MSGAGPTLIAGDLPSWSVFKFPPDPAPSLIPPPYDGVPTFKNPFPISFETYNAALDYKVPLTIASVYAVSVVTLNWYNRRHKNQPWAISKTRAFKAFVIAHNVFLAVYSLVTCVAMVLALKRTFPNPSEHNAVVGTVDALCKMHGPRGLGDAATYNTSTSLWDMKNPFLHLDSNGIPDSTDVGRLWNEGLAFWGWFFYLSKFYEVLDTAIIIAKGKRSSTLQTYHHAGAMLCMWAGMRYMSPPIWMFVLVNSGVHAMMYTYYTVSALGVRVPQVVKRTLTTLQITQFLVGASFALVHLFVSYTVPVPVRYEVIDKVLQSSSSTVSSVVSTVTSSEALPTATGAAIAFLKKLVYRAAGEEGLAENIFQPSNHNIAPVAGTFADHAQQFLRHEPVKRIVYRTEYQAVPCIDTSGQAFAIYLNLIYLAPLTGLFMRFFVKSYLRRTSPNAKHATKLNAMSKAGLDAIHGVDREIGSLGRSAEDGVSSGIQHTKNNIRGRTQKSSETRNGSLSPENQKFVDSFNRKVSKRLDDIGEGTKDTEKRAKLIAKEAVTGTPKSDRALSPNGNGIVEKAEADSANGVVKTEANEDMKKDPNGKA
ncbi:hypothetical protein K504DRAFT_367785 [Pleomassaria siparia CBS 279.74]|uniref:Elongation of fatty acids protein n=1 Tax=Pleomassaria siparia CBS 279.74 TaxID=1314801 RepID=A0A6G1KRV6_9PLEO|nr:hypothetical protein K504DRAFT_367785 [Pleomassaria siparia CBS 279.74]